MGADPHPAVQVVTAFWEGLEARNWGGVRHVLADDLVVELPATGERFTNADDYLAFQRTYPEGWTIQVQRIGVVTLSEQAPGPADTVVVMSEVQVPQHDVGVFAVVSLASVRGGLIVAAREFWVTCAGEEPPAWRAHLTQRYDGLLAPTSVE